jgi:coenzyme F420-dependent glucose-6-phosphate dehydrogenase
VTEFGYALSSEEHPPDALVRNARRAEEAGFTFALISDHFHPWTDRQGQSPFVWSVIGGIAASTERLRVGTGVTCPMIRTHPAIIAQAAATCAAMMPSRFFLGVGSGENLNEHIVGAYWPPSEVRLDMLKEAVAVIRLLWQGETESHQGRYYTVDNARIYTLPREVPPIYVAAGGSKSASLAGHIGDGLIATSPSKETVEQFERNGGIDKPRYGKLTVCWAEDQGVACRTAREWWPTAVLKGELGQELRLPTHFEQATADVTEEQVAEEIVCGPDPQRHIEAICKFLEAGFDDVYVHQVGPDQEGFFRFYEREVLPTLRSKAPQPSITD